MPLEEYRDKVRTVKRCAALDAAVDLFLEQGFDRTSLQQVARQAGISSATLFKHFPTKAALFGGIMAQFWEVTPEFEHPPLKPGCPEEGLLWVGREYARLLRRPQTAPLFRVIISEAPRFPELGRALFERGKGPYLNHLYSYLAAEVEAGALVIEDIPLAARQFLGMINDLIFWPTLLSAEYKVTDEQVERVVQEAVKTMLARYGRS
jgi:TetR/AcrR family transcriptional regulator of autoinduction and epiphytic fitness